MLEDQNKQLQSTIDRMREKEIQDANKWVEYRDKIASKTSPQIKEWLDSKHAFEKTNYEKLCNMDEISDSNITHELFKIFDELMSRKLFEGECEAGRYNRNDVMRDALFKKLMKQTSDSVQRKTTTALMKKLLERKEAEKTTVDT